MRPRPSATSAGHQRYRTSAMLVACTMLAGTPQIAVANSISIDVGTGGSVHSLSINQDPGAGNNSNVVSGAGGVSTAFTARGAWSVIQIDQTGPNNMLQGAITTGAVTPGSNVFHGTYAGGNNSHTVAIGSTGSPATMSETVSLTNTAPASTANTVSETLDTPAALADTLTVYGTNNSVTNSVSASGSIMLNQTLGDGASHGSASNSILTNNATGLSGAYIAAVAVSGDGSSQGTNNAISNVASGSGDRSFGVTLNGTSNSVFFANLAGGAGTTSESATVTADSATSGVRYGVTSQATGASSVTTTLNQVAGGGIYVQQDSTIPNATVNLTVNGNNNTLGNLSALPSGMTTTELPAGFFTSAPGVAVYQTGSNYSITATVTATSPGYTASIISSGN